MRNIYWFAIGALLVLMIALAMGCHGVPQMEPLPGDDAYTFRWDQGALHGSDAAMCPSAVFIVRNGVLEQCE
jgi:hypothetical protein